MRRKKLQWLHAFLLMVGLGLLLPGRALAQGEGPHVYLPAPDGTNVLSFTYMNLSTNLNFSQSLLIKNSSLELNIYVPTYQRYFSIGGRLSEVTFSPIVGSLSGTATVASRVFNSPLESGFFDPYIGFRIGLVGAPALKPAEFMKHKQGFQLYALAGVYLPLGAYKSGRPVNLGTNRWATRLGAPMVMPFGNPARPVDLEVVPSVTLFSTNDAPFGAAMRREQQPLLQIENHLSYNVLKKLWGSLDLRYQYGGQTTTDGVPDDNGLQQLGGGVTLGYAITSKLQAQAGYGDLIYKNDGSHGRMWRFRGVYVF
jgi:Putative MetA-pathway of phenol degradation